MQLRHFRSNVKNGTNSFSEVSQIVYTSPQSWEQSSKFQKPDEAKFVVINYHHVTDPQGFIALENKFWQPFIKGEMETTRTRKVAWAIRADHYHVRLNPVISLKSFKQMVLS